MKYATFEIEEVKESTYGELKKNTKISKSLLWVVVVLGVLSVFAFMGNKQNVVTSTLDNDGAASTGKYFKVEATNMYIERDGPIGGQYIIWPLMAEPFRASTFTIAALSGDDSITIQSEVDGETYEGTSFDHTFESTGIHTVTVSHVDDGNTVASESFTVMVKYVKREIRELLDDDFNNYMSTLKIVYSISQEEGRDIYGESYHGIDHFIQVHLFAAGKMECDHWHDDAGIYVSHSSFTLAFEQNLQLVNPAVTVPYWDFASDAETYDMDWQDTDILSEQMFGSVNSIDDSLPDDYGYPVTDGLFAYTPVSASSDFTLSNAYGLLRSPWNNNQSPYMTRMGTVLGYTYQDTFPSCSAFVETFELTSLADFQYYMNGETHGPVHILIGGQWNNNADIIVSYAISKKHLLMFKDFWRQGYTECPSSCSIDEGEECSCMFNRDLIGAYTYEEMMEDSGLTDYLTLYGSETEAIYEELVLAFSVPGFAGEMYSSTSPYDPTFWLIHPTIERLLFQKRILSAIGAESFDETWGYSHNSANPSDTQLFCDWSDLDALGMPNCYTQTCSGHNAYDIVSFGNFLGKNEIYTNAEYYSFASPYSDDFPYTYANYEWSTCEDLGYSFA